MRRLLLGALVVALGMLLAPYAVAYTGSYTPDTGINGTVHDLSQAVNGMNYVAIPAECRQPEGVAGHRQRHDAGQRLPALPQLS